MVEVITPHYAYWELETFHDLQVNAVPVLHNNGPGDPYTYVCPSYKTNATCQANLYVFTRYNLLNMVDKSGALNYTAFHQYIQATGLVVEDDGLSY
jgi:hypothetical protein